MSFIFRVNSQLSQTCGHSEWRYGRSWVSPATNLTTTSTTIKSLLMPDITIETTTSISYCLNRSSVRAKSTIWWSSAGIARTVNDLHSRIYTCSCCGKTWDITRKTKRWIRLKCQCANGDSDWLPGISFHGDRIVLFLVVIVIQVEGRFSWFQSKGGICAMNSTLW